MKGPFFVPPLSMRCTTLAVFLLGAASGCGTKPNNFVKVSGIVTLEGVPLEGAKVTYYPASGDAPAMGITNRAGRFELSTFDLKTLKATDGALPGEYKVTVEMPSPAGRNPGGTDDLRVGHIEREKALAQKGGGKASDVKVLHANYADASKTPLRQTVPPPAAVELKLMKSGT
jgi:hypothetical protein